MEEKLLRYFSLNDFDSPDEPGSYKNMKRSMMLLIDSIRKDIGRPIIVNSAYRTEKHNEKVGGVESSSHRNGWALDVHCPDNQFRLAFIKSAIKHGVSRIGIYRTFIHIDMDPDKPQNTMWYT